MIRRSLPEPLDPPVARGPARVGRRTKDLVKRLEPGEIAVIDHEDLDRVAAEGLVQARVGGVINAARSISGRYPNVGPLLLAAAGIPLVDNVGGAVLDRLVDGDVVEIAGRVVRVDGADVARGDRQSIDSLDVAFETARQSMGDELERFAENTLEYMRRERHLLTDRPDVPPVAVSFRGRQALIVVRGHDYREDLEALRRGGYLAEMRPVCIGVDGGADALLAIGERPDIIIGDFDSVSEEALRCGAQLIVHGFPDGRAPGTARLEELGLDHSVFCASGTSEDIAMLLAYELGAELIVAVGTHSSMTDFLDKGRPGMASTFLVRLRVGPILVDAKGVSRLYQARVRKRDMTMLIGAAVATWVTVVVVTPAGRVFARGLWLWLRSVVG